MVVPKKDRRKSKTPSDTEAKYDLGKLKNIVEECLRTINVIKKDVNLLKNIKIDDEISETSTNAIQNKAVKKYVDSLGITGQNYKLISSVNVNEDTQFISIEKDDLGNTLESLNLKKLLIIFKGSFTTTVSSCRLFFRVSDNQNLAYHMYNSYTVTADTLYFLWAEGEKIFISETKSFFKNSFPQKWVAGYNVATDLITGVSTMISLGTTSAYMPFSKTKKVEFGCYKTDNLIKSGSTILLFGVS